MAALDMDRLPTGQHQWRMLVEGLLAGSPVLVTPIRCARIGRGTRRNRDPRLAVIRKSLRPHRLVGHRAAGGAV